jgi:hypothetical protein
MVKIWQDAYTAALGICEQDFDLLFAWDAIQVPVAKSTLLFTQTTAKNSLSE